MAKLQDLTNGYTINLETIRKENDLQVQALNEKH